MGMRTGPSEPGDDERGTATKARRCLELHSQLLGPPRAAFAERLVAAGQGALFCKWSYESNDGDSDSGGQSLLLLLDCLIEADAKYPGGVETYISGCRTLLSSAGVDEKQILRYQIGVKDSALHFFPPENVGLTEAIAATPSVSAVTKDGTRQEAEASAPSGSVSTEPVDPQARQPAPGVRKLTQTAKQADMLNLRCWAKFWCDR